MQEPKPLVLRPYGACVYDFDVSFLFAIFIFPH